MMEAKAMTESEELACPDNTRCDPSRLVALDRSCLMDTAPEPAFNRLVKLASRVLNTPVSLVSLVDANRQFFKAQIGLPEPVATERQTGLARVLWRAFSSLPGPFSRRRWGFGSRAMNGA